MAKKRKNSRSKQHKQTLRYEVYGILIIVMSIISLAGRANDNEVFGIGSVGRSFSYIFLFLAGEIYFVIPLVLIYIGLYVMIKRSWPAQWTIRKTGILLLLLGLLTSFHISLFQQLDPDNMARASSIIAQPYHNITDRISQDISVDTFMNNLGGGMIGALIFGILYFLFDQLGSKLIVVAMFAIGIICMTGWSYVEIGRNLKQWIARGGKQFAFRMREALFLLRGRRSAKVSSEHLDEEVQPNDESVDTPDEEHVESDVVSSDEPWTEPVSAGEDEEETPRIRDFEQHVDEQLEEDPVRNAEYIAQAEPSLPDNREPSYHPGEAEHEIRFRQAPPQEPYQLPPLHLLDKPESGTKSQVSTDYRANARKLEETLESFGVRARVVEVVRGPTVTRYEVQPDTGVKVSRIVSLTDDIALALAAKDIRMEAPIPGKAAIGIEVPNSIVSMVTLREVMESSTFQEASSKVSVGLGRDISGQPIVADLAKMPHLLVAGATGSGKSVCINGLITSILYKAKPDEVKFLMIDPKKVELNGYNGIPHLLAPVVTDPRRASMALRKVVGEMEARYERFSKTGTRNIEGYNEYVARKLAEAAQQADDPLAAAGDGDSGLSETASTAYTAQQREPEWEPLPYIVVIVDELADLMMVAASDVEESIGRLAQMARAAGIHLIIATQRPSVNVITGVIKANIPSRIAFGVSSQVDSRTILDSAGAEKLLGRGDMLFLPVGASKPVRIQGAFLSDGEVEAVVDFAKQQAEAEYREELVPEVDDTDSQTEEVKDELYDQAVQIVVEAKQASVSLLQRRMRIGYTRAARLIDSMEAGGIVGPYEGSKPREVLITIEEYNDRHLSG